MQQIRDAACPVKSESQEGQLMADEKDDLDPNKMREDMENGKYAKYEKKYSEEGFLKKVKKHASKAGVKVIYKAFELYYVAKSPDCPVKVKLAIFAALGYFISPLDIIPDVIPVAGFTDDLGVLGLALAYAMAYIDDDIRAKARERIKSIFGEEALAKLDD